MDYNELLSKLNVKTIVVDMDKKIKEPLKTKQGDVKSRYLLFSFIKNSTAFNLTNTTVRIFINKPDKKVVFDDLVVIDSVKGLFVYEISSQVQALAGWCTGELVIYSGDAKLSSIPFELEVIASVNSEDAVVSTNEFSALTKALATVQNIDNRFSNHQTQLDNKVGKDELKSGLDLKRNKSTLLNMPDMGQDVKVAMTGGSVAVVGKNAILTENIVRGQVTPFTTNFFNNVNIIDIATVEVVAGIYVNNPPGNNIIASGDVNCIIMKLPSNATVTLVFPDIISVNRQNTVCNSSGIFTVGQVYDGVVYSRSGNKITFTTTDKNWICMYFYSGNIEESIRNEIKYGVELFEGDSEPNYKNSTIKKENLPQDIRYSNEPIHVTDCDFFNNYNLLTYKLKNDIVNGNNNDAGFINISIGSNARLLFIYNVEPNTKYYLKLPQGYDRTWILTTNKDTFVNGGQYKRISHIDRVDGYKEFTTDNDTVTISVYFYSGNNGLVDFNKQDIELLLDVEDAGKGVTIKTEYMPELDSFLRGKIVLTMGDSITAIEEGDTNNYPRSWKKYFRELLSPKKLVSTAVPGATWRDKDGTIYDGNPVINGPDNNLHNVMGNQLEKIIRGKDPSHPNYVHVSDYDHFDIIIIACGINDGGTQVIPSDDEINSVFWGTSSQIQDLSTIDRRTWQGSIRYVCDNLKKIYPNSKIYLSTPVQTSSNNYNTVKLKREIITSIGNRSAVFVIDSTNCGIYDMSCPSGGKEGDFNDGLHLSPQGAKKLGQYIGRFIKNNYSE